MEFVVIVVLDHGEPELARQIEQTQPAVRWQSDGRGKLMVRSQKDRAHLVRPAHPLDLVHVDTLLVQVNGDDLRATFLEHADRSLVGKRLNQYDVPWTNQHAGSQAHPHLTS